MAIAMHAWSSSTSETSSCTRRERGGQQTQGPRRAKLGSLTSQRASIARRRTPGKTGAPSPWMHLHICTNPVNNSEDLHGAKSNSAEATKHKEMLHVLHFFCKKNNYSIKILFRKSCGCLRKPLTGNPRKFKVFSRECIRK